MVLLCSPPAAAQEPEDNEADNYDSQNYTDDDAGYGVVGQRLKVILAWAGRHSCRIRGGLVKGAGSQIDIGMAVNFVEEDQVWREYVFVVGCA